MIIKPTQPTKPLMEYRCTCGKLLFKSPYFEGAVEIKCRRCGRITLFEQKLPRPSG
jgi:phage FluMu protein Com